MRKFCSLLLLLAFTSYASAGLRLAGGDPVALPAGTASPHTLTVEFFNDSGSAVTLLGAQVLDFALSSSFYGGSGATAPSLANTTPDVTTTPFVDLGVTSPTAPLGTLGANNFVGFNIAAGDSIALGTIDVNIPADFLGEFVLQSTTGDLVVSLGPAGDLVSQGTSIDGTVTVGTGTVVPEPSSFLFLGLVGTGALGLRRYTRRDEEEEG